MSANTNSYSAMKDQLLANAFALYGTQHPKSSRYEVITTRTYSPEKGRSTHRASLIVYCDQEDPSAWKLLKTSRPNVTQYDAVDQLDIWVQDELDGMIGKMNPGDVCKAGADQEEIKEETMSD